MAERARVYPLRRVTPQEPPSKQPPAQQRPAQLPPAQKPPAGQPPPENLPPPREPLWREVLGRRLRALRQDQRETLSQTAGRAGISPQYLSEIERGRKEPSSEMIAALAGALGTTLTGLTEQVAEDLRQYPIAVPSAPSRAFGPVMLRLAA